MLKQLVHLLSSKTIHIILIINCIIIKSLYEIIYQDFGIDKVVQLLVSKSQSTFGKLALHIPLPSNLSSSSLYKLEGWPLGYSIIGYLTSLIGDIMTWQLILDIVAVTCIVIYSVKILRLNNTSELKINLYLILITLSFSPFSYLTSSDLLVSTIFTVMTYYFLKDINTSRSKYIVGLSIISFTLGFLKLSSVYLLSIFPIVYILIYFQTKHKGYFSKAIFFSISTVFFLLLQNYIFPFVPKKKQTESGFYPENLSLFDHFPLKALFRTEELTHKLNLPNYSYLLLGISGLISIYLLILFFQSKKKNYLYLTSIIAIVSSVFFFSYLSLTKAPEKIQIPFWTYVCETRYYGPVMILMLTCFFIPIKSNSKWVRYISITVISLSIFINSILFLAQLKYLYNNELKGTYSKEHQQIISIANTISNYESNELDIIYCDNPVQRQRLCLLSPPVRGITKDNLISSIKQGLPAKNQINIFLVLDNTNPNKILNTLKTHNISFIHKFDTYSLYQVKSK